MCLIDYKSIINLLRWRLEFVRKSVVDGMMNDAKNESSFQLNYREYYSDRANRDTTCLFLDTIVAQH